MGTPRCAGRHAPAVSLGILLALGLSALGLLLPVGAALGREIPFADATSLQAAISRAGAEGVLVVLIVVRAEAPLDGELLAILRDPRVERALQRSVPLLLAGDRHPEISTRFGIRRFPVAVFIDGAGREVGHITGLTDPAAFAERATEIMGGPAVELKAKELRAGEEMELSDLVAAAQASWNAGERLQAAALFERAVRVIEAAGEKSRVAACAAARAHLGLAEHLRSAGKTQEAEEQYRSALEALARTDPSSAVDVQVWRARAVIGLALSARASRRSREAAETLAAAIDAPAGSPTLEETGRERALYLLGRILLETGQEEAGRERLAHCAREFPGSRYGERSRRYLDPALSSSAPSDQSALPASR